MFDRVPCAFRPLAAIERIFASHALSPGIDTVAVDGQQKNAPAEGAFKARLEKLDERHLDFAKGDSFNFHSLNSDSPHLCCRIHPLLLPATEQKLAAPLLGAFI